MQILLIGNPISGHGKALVLIHELVDCLVSAGHGVEVYLTQASGDANLRARAIAGFGETDFKDSYDCIVVAGGDGTLNEVINGLVDPARIPIALLPCGTANLLARELELPCKPAEIADMITGGVVRKIDMGMAYFGRGDVGSCVGRRFIMVASCGFDSLVIEEISRTRTGTLGFWGYPFPILRVMSKYVPPQLRISVDGESSNLVNQGKAEMVVVGNIRSYAGFFVIAENADCCSGEFDICMLSAVSIFDLIRYAWRGFYNKGLSGLAGVEYIGGSEILIESGDVDDSSGGGNLIKREFPVELDGEFGGYTPVRILLEPAVIPIMVVGNGK